MKKSRELIEQLNSLQILQTSHSWDESLPKEVWDEFFEDCFTVVETGLNIDKHRWYELSTTVIELVNCYIGVTSVTGTFSEQKEVEDIGYILKFCEMQATHTITYIPINEEDDDYDLKCHQIKEEDVLKLLKVKEEKAEDLDTHKELCNELFVLEIMVKECKAKIEKCEAKMSDIGTNFNEYKKRNESEEGK